MSRLPLTLAVLALATPVLAAQPPKPAKLGQCVACHGENGIGRSVGTPHLAGQDEAYLINALNAYRSGSRKHVPMGSLANTLQPRDIAALARWYSQQPGFSKRMDSKP